MGSGRGSEGAGNALHGGDTLACQYALPASANSGRFGFTGQIWLPEIGLYYYRARIYSPTLGRFMQTDPIGYGDGMNIYAYVGNDPVNFTDPSGLVNEPIRVHCTDYCFNVGGTIVITAQRDRTLELFRDLNRIDLTQLLTALGRTPDPGADPDEEESDEDTAAEDEEIVVTAQNQTPLPDRFRGNFPRYPNCTFLGQTCLMINPSGPASRRNCRGLEEGCNQDTYLYRNVANDRGAPATREVRVGNACYLVWPSGRVTIFFKVR